MASLVNKFDSWFDFLEFFETFQNSTFPFVSFCLSQQTDRAVSGFFHDIIGKKTEPLSVINGKDGNFYDLEDYC